MKSLYWSLALWLIALSSCKKESGPPPPPQGDPNNELSAVVSYLGGKDSIHKANGSRTFFIKSSFRPGDTTITFRGSIGTGGYSLRTIEIRLGNITAVGTYPFGSDTVLKRFAECTYEVGALFSGQGVWDIYFTRSGSITIDLLTPTSIQGTFAATCSRSGDQNRIEIKNGSFKGTFSQ